MWVIGSIVFLVPAMLITLGLAGVGAEKQSRESVHSYPVNGKQTP
jgi:hypothetical protein